MLKRVVRMEFDPDKVQDFLTMFDGVKEKISAQEGCTHLELCKDSGLSHVYYTLSVWEKEEDLERYRHSDLFIDTWTKTKVLFAGKPQAFSLMES